MGNTLDITYSYFNHLHNYAIWTAARAAQRGFTTTKNIQAAINSTYLEKLLEGEISISDKEEFDRFHVTCCKQIMDKLKNLLRDNSYKVTYGRAAKIVNIYIKTAIVIPNPESNLSFIVHPPIDRILLSNLIKFKSFQFDTISWTQFTENDYFDVIRKQRERGYGEAIAFWKIEAYWSPSEDSE